MKYPVNTQVTENDPTLIYANVSGTLEFGTQFRIEGSSADGNELTITATNPTADRTATFDATGTVSLITNTETLTNKTLTSPKINEDVAVTSTATELNLLDGVTGITLGSANELLVVGTDGSVFQVIVH